MTAGKSEFLSRFHIERLIAGLHDGCIRCCSACISGSMKLTVA